MILLEPLRRKRARLAAKLRAGTTDKTELKAIAALIDDANFALFQMEFLMASECPKCHQTLRDVEEWQSKDHEQLFQVCSELNALEMKAYHEAFGQPA